MDNLISIVMPVKNAALYLEACLESILSQSEINWELIAINDHSSDHSMEILQSHESKDAKISVFNNNGNGIIDALRLAYSKTKGNYIHRMDADDLMVKTKLEKLKTILTSRGRGNVATGKVQYFSDNGVSEGYRNYEKWLNNLCENNSHWKEIYKECVIPSPCWLVYREDFEAAGGFNSNIYPEDYDLAFRFYELGLNVLSSNEVLHLWRDHLERSSRNHEHYHQNTFFNIKIHYFLKLSKKANRPLIIWGAGKKGKKLAKILEIEGLDFTWVSNNPNKHGKEIYNKLMQSFRIIVKENRPQILITVAQRNAKKEIIEFLNGQKMSEGLDYYFLS